MLGRRSLGSKLIPIDPEIDRTFHHTQRSFNQPSISTMGEHIRTLNELFAPASACPPNCIVLPRNNADQFKIRAAIINMLPKFHGFESEQPYIHLNKFLTICQIFKNQNIDEEGVKLRLFPMTLEDRAAAWLYSLVPSSITSWEQLSRKFMAKFYPMVKTEKIKDAIRTFRGQTEEEFFQIWERFNDLLVKWPHHGLDKADLVHFFYKGLPPAHRNMIESMHKGRFMNQTPDQAYEFLVDLAENAQNWSSYGQEIDRDEFGSRKSCTYEIKIDPDLKNVMSNLINGVNNLSKKFDAFTVSTSSSPHKEVNPVMKVEHEPCLSCILCNSSEHRVECCPNLATIKAEQANALNSYSAFKKPTPNSFSSVYHPDNRFHPNFSYKQSEPIQHLGGPPDFQKNYPRMGPSQMNQPLVPSVPSYNPPIPQQPAPTSLETIMATMMKQQQDFIQQQQQTNMAQTQTNQFHAQAIAKLEVSLSQLSNSLGDRRKGELPSQPVPNPPVGNKIKGREANFRLTPIQIQPMKSRLSPL